MKISALEEYGLRCLVQLARAGAVPIPLVGSGAKTRTVAIELAGSVSDLIDVGGNVPGNGNGNGNGNGVSHAPAAAEPTTLSARQIAEREGLTIEYVSQILAELRRAGLVTSTRGVRGGFRLAIPPREITVGSLFRALDGPIADNLCESFTGNRDVCAHSEGCAVRPVWSELQRRMYQFLDGVTVGDLADGVAVEQRPQVVPLAALRRR
ncbi:MAG: Rrf2 family transcriptional regulator [Planctomycetes bacterium]|nr:Rrf2 family transcriptional regulator [Planctomycetota bacterium]